MARGRDIKPGFFDSDELAEVSRDHRLLFIALWTVADREGRIEDRPSRIKVHSFPLDVDMTPERISSMIDDLEAARGKFLRRYEANGMRCIVIGNFKKHQHIHPKEKASELPEPPPVRELPVITGKDSNKPRNSALPSEPSSLLPPSSSLSASDPDPERARVERLPQECTCGMSSAGCPAPTLCGAAMAKDDAKRDMGSEGGADEIARSAVESLARPKSAHDWLEFFKVRWREKHQGRHYGKGIADAKALGNFGDLLASLPTDQRASDWESRERIVAEFLARTDTRTVGAGWPFCFFATDFRGLAMPPDKRPEQPRPMGHVQPMRQAVYPILSRAKGRST